MNTKIMTKVLIVTGAAALASVASAQRVGAGAAIHAPAMPPPPAFSASATTGGSMASSAAVHAPVVPESSVAAQGAGRAGADITSPSTGVNANATDHASAEGQANGLAVATVASDRTSSTLRMNETVDAIRDAKFAARDRVTADVQARLEDSDRVVAGLKAQADASGDKAHAAFAQALADVRKQERQVRANLRAAAKASESNWGSVQAELAKSYGAYAHAVATASLAAQGSAGTTK